MGKSPKSDATEAALSAVEEALKIDFGSVSDLEEEQPAPPSPEKSPEKKDTASKDEKPPASTADAKTPQRGERNKQ